MSDKTLKEIIDKLELNSIYPVCSSPQINFFDENIAKEITNNGYNILDDIIKSAKELDMK